MGGSGVQRPVKFAKYLQRFGWDPIVVAPDPDIYHTFDDSLLQELNDSSIRVERVQNSPLIRAGKKSINPSPRKPWKASLLKWITSWFFLPDNKKGWINDAVNRCLELIEAEPISAVFATAPPYSNLIVAQKIKKRTGIPVIMDLRDDWLESHLIRYPTRWHFNKMKKIEAYTLHAADHITVVNSFYKSKINDRLGKQCPEITVIPNGFDRENFDQTVSVADHGKFSILYSGMFYESRKPDWFLQAVKQVLERNPEIKEHIQLQFQGGLNESHWKTINRLGLSKYVLDFGYLRHQEAVQNVINADILFLTLGDRKYNSAVTPGKVFEYMGSLKPILAFIPEGITRSLLNNYGAAVSVGIKDVNAGANAVEEFYTKWKQQKLPQGDPDFVKTFERSNLTAQLSGILEVMTEENVSKADK
jgi:glycosyltransferase involved in cell wall biosynthesis